MYCLEKLQKELAYFLDLDLRDLPKVQDVLKAQGYTRVQKGNEIIELEGAGKLTDEMLGEIKGILKSGEQKVVFQTLPAEQAIKRLESIKAEPLPAFLSKEDFLENGLEQVINKKNFVEHLQKAADSKERISFLNLIEPTQTRPDLELITANKKGEATTEYIKAFENQDKKLFYVLITPQENDKILLTGFPTSKKREILKRIRNAKEVKARDLGEISSAQSHNESPTPSPNSTTNLLQWQRFGDVLESALTLQDGTKILLSKDRLGNLYAQSSLKLEAQSYDELMRAQSFAKLAQSQMQEDIALKLEARPLAQALEALEAQSAPKELNAKELETILNKFHNAENLLAHFEGKDERIPLFNLLESTMQDAQIQWIKDNKEKYLKRFVNSTSQDEPYFYLLVTKDKNQTFITHFKTRDVDYLSRQIMQADEIQKGADIIGDFRQQAGSALERKSPTSTSHSTPKASKSGLNLQDSAQIQKELQEQEEKHLAQKEASRLSREKQAKALQEKEAALGKSADEQSLELGESIPFTPLRATSIVLNDESAPLKAQFAIIDIKDIKPSFEKGGTQGRIMKQENVIQKIIEDFKPELIFYQEGSANGIPIIARDGQVVAGNHRSQAIKEILTKELHKGASEAYKKAAKDFLGIELKDNQMLVRILQEDISQRDILSLAFSSNIGRESSMGEKALSTLSLYKNNIKSLPAHIESSDVNELKALVAKLLDKQGNGLNTFEPNLALLAQMSKNARNSDILSALDSIKGSPEYKNKILSMYVDNAGSFYNLANHSTLTNLEFRDLLAEAVSYTAKADSSRELDFSLLNKEIESLLNLAKDTKALEHILTLDPHKVENLTSQVFGLALAKFVRQENPSTALYDALKDAPKALQELTQPTFFTQGKALSEVDIYDFLGYLVGLGQSSQSQSQLLDLLPKLRDLKNALKGDDLPPTPPNAPKGIKGELESAVSDVLDKTKPLRMLEKAQLDDELLEEAKQQNAKLWIGNFENKKLAQELGLDTARDIKITMNGSAIAHIQKRHGADSVMAKNGQPPIETKDYANHADFVNNADKSKVILSDDNQKLLVSGKQVNGYYIIAESISTKDNELKLKSMYKENGKLENNEFFKEGALPDHINGGESLRVNPSNSLDLDAPSHSTTNAQMQQTMQKFSSDELKGETAASLRGDEITAAIHNSTESNAKNAISQELKEIIDSSPQKGRDMQLIGRENFTPEIVQYLHKNNKKVAIEKLDSKEAEALGFKHPNDVRLTIDSSAINHTLNRHGADSALAKQSGQKAVSYEDITNYRDIVKNADETLQGIDNLKTPVIVSFKQVNGHYVVVEQMRKGQNELSFKTMFKGNGNYKESKSYKDTISQSSNATEGYEPTANSFALANTADSTTNAQMQQTMQKIKEAEAKHKPIIEAAEKKLLEHKQAVEAAAKQYKENLDKWYDFKVKNPAFFDKNLTDKQREKLLPAYTKALKDAGLDLRKMEADIDKKISLEDKSSSIRMDRFFAHYNKELEKIQAYMPNPPTYKHTETIKWNGNKIEAEHNLAEDMAFLRTIHLKGQIINDDFATLVRNKAEEYFNIKPIAEFGTNYAEHYHSPETAIEKLLSERQGQVAGAFYKKELGDIDLVWGDSSFGLEHILAKHADEFEALGGVAKGLSEIIKNGDLVKTHNGYNIVLGDYKVGLNIGWNQNGKKIGDNKWIVTAFDNAKSLREKQGSNSASITKGETLPLNSRDNSTTNLPTKQRHTKNMQRPIEQSVLESSPKMEGQRVEIQIPKEQDYFKNLRNRAKGALSAAKGKIVENLENHMQASLSSEGINKMISTQAVNKSLQNGYTKEEHFASVENVLELFRISTLAQSEPPTNKSPDVIAYHKFIANYTINNKNTKAKITLRETYQGGNKIYSLELLELEKAKQ